LIRPSRKALVCLAALAGLGAASSAREREAGGQEAAAAAVPQDGTDVLVRALRDELERSMTRLSLPQMPRPYYLAYSVLDYDETVVGASFGALITRDREKGRLLRVSVRVGGPELDNTNLFGGFKTFDRPVQLPLEDDYGAIRRRVWLATDDAYKDAVEALEKKRAALSTQAVSSDSAGDFSTATPAHVVVAKHPAAFDWRSAEKLVRDTSALYREYPEIQSGTAVLALASKRRLFVSSEGALVDEPTTLVRFDAVGRAQAEDGMRLERLVSYNARLISGMPDSAVLSQAIHASAADLVQGRLAPAVEDYAGPVLFEPRAATQLLRALIAEQFSGTPAPRGGDARMMQAAQGLESDLASRVGQRVLPAGFSVVDDPRHSEIGGSPALGFFRADDEGVLARAVQLVTDGMLRGLLMSREPRRGFLESNGHGRAGLSGPARGRPANLVFTTMRGLGTDALKRRLVSEVRAAGLTYGIVVRALEEPDLDGDGTPSWMRDRDSLPLPVALFKVGLDGRERPLRGGTLGGIELRTLKTIVAAGREPSVLSYFASSAGGVHAGPLSGARMMIWGIPTSIAAPALLFPDVDVRRIQAPQERPPLLARPKMGPGGPATKLP
jgi:TldD protein